MVHPTLVLPGSLSEYLWEKSMDRSSLRGNTEPTLQNLWPAFPVCGPVSRAADGVGGHPPSHPVLTEIVFVAPYPVTALLTVGHWGSAEQISPCDGLWLSEACLESSRKQLWKGLWGHFRETIEEERWCIHSRSRSYCLAGPQPSSSWCWDRHEPPHSANLVSVFWDRASCNPGWIQVPEDGFELIFLLPLSLFFFFFLILVLPSLSFFLLPLCRGPNHCIC